MERRQPFSKSTSLNGLIYNSLHHWAASLCRTPGAPASASESSQHLVAVNEEPRKNKTQHKQEAAWGGPTGRPRPARRVDASLTHVKARGEAPSELPLRNVTPTALFREGFWGPGWPHPMTCSQGCPRPGPVTRSLLRLFPMPRALLPPLIRGSQLWL